MRKVHLIIALAASTLLSPSLFAAGSGGGGSTPSQSAPQYDAATEYGKGVAALQVKDFRAAKTAFDRVISVAPKNAPAQYFGGLARVGLQDWKGARRFFERAVKADPKMIAAWEKLGVSQARLGDRMKAEKTLSTINARAAACGSCADAAALKVAQDAVTSALSSKPTAQVQTISPLLISAQAGDTRYLEAVALINGQRYEAAIVSLNASTQAIGPHPDILTYLGFAHRKLKRFGAAEAYYRQALALAPSHRGATEYFGELMVELGDLPGAKKMLAQLDAECRFGCAEAEELRKWIVAGRSPHS